MNKILTFGVYDYFRLGHLRLFKQCKEYADYLIVAVQDGDYIKRFKPEAKILYSTEERIEILEALRIVDKVILYQTVSPETLGKIEFDILALREDHIGDRVNKVIEWCQTHGKKIVRLKKTQGISSSEIKNEMGGHLDSKKNVLTVGVFDYFHLGHLRLFKNCRKLGESLTVAVQKGNYILKYKPNATILYSTNQRIEMVQALKCVDKVITYTDVETAVKNENFHIFAVGGDQNHQGFMRACQWVADNNKIVKEVPRTPGICSSRLKEELEKIGVEKYE